MSAGAVDGTRARRTRRATRIRLAVAPWLAAGLFGGCADAGSAGSSDAPAAVRDSAGVAIVESREPTWRDGSPWTVAAEPSLEIGRLDGPAAYSFSSVMGVTRLSDGRIVVGDAGAHRIHFYDADGEHLQSVGGEGEGPGEFARPLLMRRFGGDSILVHDFGLERASVFAPDGDFVRTFELEPVAGGAPNPAVPLAGGRLVAAASSTEMTPEIRARAAETGAVVPGTTLMLVYTTEGAPLDTVGEFPLPERYMLMGDGSSGGGWSMSVLAYPFARTIVTASHGDRLYIGWSGESEIRRYGPTGVLERIVRLPREPRPVSDADVARFRDSIVAAVENENGRREMERIYREMEMHDTMPAFDDFLADPEGNLWVRAPDDSDRATAAWDVFDADGRWLGAVDIPSGLDVHEIGADYLIGTTTDELDVQRVVVHELTRSDG